MSDLSRRETAGYRSIEEPDRVVLTFRTGRRAIGCFMFIFLLGWSGGCALLLYRLREDPKFENLMFAGPFFAGWIFVAFILLQNLLGRERFTLDASGALLATRTVLRSRKSFMPLDELVYFGTAEQSDDTRENPATTVLELRTLGRPIRFGGTATSKERQAVRTLLNRRLREFQKQERRPPRLDLPKTGLAFGRRLSGELLSEDEPLRTTNDPPIEPPHDMNWRLREGFDTLSFTLRGRWTTGGFIAVLLLNVFWSGITGTFVYQLYWGDPRPHGFDWLQQFLFLIPFELVGLVMFLGLLLVACEPFRCYRWRFAPHQIVCSLTWFGLGRRWRYTIDHVDRLEVQKVPYSEKKLPQRLPLATLWAPKGCPTYDIVLLAAPNRELLRIEGLTLGEACHWADTLLRKRPEWFD